MTGKIDLRTAALTIVTLIAFAANSILCRLALGAGEIDPVSFTTIRIGSGALMLAPLALARKKTAEPGRAGSWAAALALFVYAIAFSLAYVSLSAGVGALILFGAVQLTMIAVSIRSEERPRLLEWFGMLVAFGGLVYLVLPGLTAPDAVGTALMVVAGIAWGAYTLLGRGVPDPVRSTAGNFVRAMPLMLGVSLIAWGSMDLDTTGVMLAISSGAVASGLGYVAWYAALRGLTTTTAAIVQLAVPTIAAAGGVLILDETLTIRLVIASVLTLGGIGTAIAAKKSVFT